MPYYNINNCIVRSKKMNVYDFDKTIYIKDSTLDFFKFCLKRNKKIYMYMPSLLWYGLKYIFIKNFSLTNFKEKFFSFLKHIDTDKEVEEFWLTYKKGIKEWYLNRKKEDDVIISASPEFLLLPICNELGIKHLIASKVDKNSGLFQSKNCKGEEKVVRFREIFGNAKIDEFYSDSESDMPLVKIANFSMKIKGDKLVEWK